MKELFYRLFLAKTRWLTYTLEPQFYMKDGKVVWCEESERVRQPTKFGELLYRMYHFLPQ